MPLCVFPQRKVPDQDIAQGSYLALPLTLLLLLAGYNHEKVKPCSTLSVHRALSYSTIEFLIPCSWYKIHWTLALLMQILKLKMRFSII